MTPIDFTAVLNTIKTGIINLGKPILSNYLTQLQSDAQNITNAIEDDIKTWTQQLAAGQITANDLQFLINAKKDYLEIAALTQAGAAQIQLDQFKTGVVNLIVNTLVGLIPKVA